MFSEDDINIMVKQVMSRLCQENSSNKCGSLVDNCGNKCSETAEKDSITITPSQAMIIGGILGGVLEVQSVLIDKDQTVQIVLAGSLKEKSELDMMLDQIGKLPFNEVVKAIVNRIG